ncbi:para-nitrobenzyl esterase [Mycena latifolia]|nr:para-nitrobenzyl esterase [Mycena latifolia]
MMQFLSYMLVLAAAVHCAPAKNPLKVPTSSGMRNGFVNASAPDVRQFLGVPFAVPPTGPRRFLPPAPNICPTAIVDATSFSAACPQIPLNATQPANVFTADGGGQTEFFPNQTFNEDCLTLNVWAPAAAQRAPLPVFVCFFGGGFTQGGADSLYYNPAPWVQRTQAHVVRAGTQNPGLLDQRMVLEWVRCNIGAFAFPADPIVRGVIMDSGTALFPTAAKTNDTAQAHFAAVASQLGCGGACDAAAQVDCLRGVPWEAIEALLAANASLSFLPVPDERVVFANYTARYAAGALSRVPALIGTNQHEGNAVVAHGLPNKPVNQTALDTGSDVLFLCTAAATAALRQAQGLTTYRFRYDGNFSNISPPEFPGAYHASELPLIFGTAGEFHGASTAYEDEVSAKMQDLWLAFGRDPEKGLQAAGWDTFGAGKAAVYISYEFELVSAIASL